MLKRKMRLLAPHTQENPIFFHMISQNSTLFHDVVDQMADVGFEMVIYSFGSGFDLESDNITYLEQVAVCCHISKHLLVTGTGILMTLAIKRIHNLPPYLSYVSTLSDVRQKPKTYLVFVSVV